MYKINGMYYLMIAEGGTEYGHMETIARSDNVWGPFESCPHNPILTHRNSMPGFDKMMDPDYVEFQGTGHADLVDDENGNWWLVFHAVRPTKSQLHHIGRETMLAPVEWVDGWPVVNKGQLIEAVMDVPDTPHVERDSDGFARQNSYTVEEDFTQLTALPVDWAYLRNPIEQNYRFDQGLVLTAGEDCLDGMGEPTFAGIRQRQFALTVEAQMELLSPAAQAGVTVFHTNEHHYELIISQGESGRQAVLRKRVCDMVTESAPAALPGDGPAALRIESDKAGYRFFADGQKVGEGLSQLLSTEVMAGTFTGCFFGVFCQGKTGAEARFLSFRCKA